jgi:hypothetical protein
VRELYAEAGFSSVRRVPLENPYAREMRSSGRLAGVRPVHSVGRVTRENLVVASSVAAFAVNLFRIGVEPQLALRFASTSGRMMTTRWVRTSLSGQVFVAGAVTFLALTLLTLLDIRRGVLFRT